MYLETFVNLKNVCEFKKCLTALKSIHEFVEVSENVCPFKKIAQLLSSKSVRKRGKCSSN
jgi:nitrite reductase/ring-hydroxylating ferredoxin subunit